MNDFQLAARLHFCWNDYSSGLSFGRKYIAETKRGLLMMISKHSKTFSTKKVEISVVRHLVNCGRLCDPNHALWVISHAKSDHILGFEGTAVIHHHILNWRKQLEFAAKRFPSRQVVQRQEDRVLSPSSVCSTPVIQIGFVLLINLFSTSGFRYPQPPYLAESTLMRMLCTFGRQTVKLLSSTYYVIILVHGIN